MFVSEIIKRAINSAERLRRGIWARGCTPKGDLLWSKGEDDLLRSCYPDYKAAQRALRNRSRFALLHRARKLGLVPKRRFWLLYEERILKAPYRSALSIADIEALLPGRTKQEIYAKAWRLKIKRPRKSLRLTGLPLLDQIRQKAYEFKFSMNELDAETGGGRYFNNPKYYNWRKITGALTFLGGKVVPVWPTK